MPAENNENYSWVKSCVNLEQKCNILESSKPTSSFFNDEISKSLGCCSELMQLFAWEDSTLYKWECFCIYCCGTIIQYKDNKYQVYSWVKCIGILIPY
jgi:hypothetical protein